MISNKVIGCIFSVLALVLFFCVLVFPNLGLQEKNSTASYKNTVFNEKKVTRVDLQLDVKDWEDIKANPMDEELKQASVTVNGKSVEGVAVRTKGNSSLMSVANSDSDRYSLKIDFDYYDSTQSLYGLKKLNLNNNFSDSTQMREFVSYELMEQMGIPTPSHSYMYVTVNGEDYGLFLGVEAVDETFLANNYDSNTGFLYKPDGVGSDLKWISDQIEDYSGVDLKTNKGNSEESKLISMLDAINNGGDLEEYLDVDEMLKYFALNTALVSLDSYQGSMKHNYYLYEEDGVFSIIPWDYNMSFGGFGGMGGFDDKDGQKVPGGEKGTTDKEKPSKEDENDMQRGGLDMGGIAGELMSDSSINFSVLEPVSGTSLEERPLLNALLSNETYNTQYQAYLKEIATTIFTEEDIESITTDLAAILTTYVEADPSKFYTTKEFLAGVSGENSLPEFAKQRSDSILKQLSGELVAESQASDGSQESIQGPNGENPQGQEGQKGLPSGFDMDQLPKGFDPSQIPSNFDPSQMMGGIGGPNGERSNSEDGTTLADHISSPILSAISIGILMIVLFGVWIFKRRSGFR
jgi:spore coat protein CotH